MVQNCGFTWAGRGPERHRCGTPHVQARNIGYALDSPRRPVWDAPGFFCGSQAEYGIVDGIMGEEILCHPVSEYGKTSWRYAAGQEDAEGPWALIMVSMPGFSAFTVLRPPLVSVSTCLDTFKGGRMELGPVPSSGTSFM